MRHRQPMAHFSFKDIMNRHLKKLAERVGITGQPFNFKKMLDSFGLLVVVETLNLKAKGRSDQFIINHFTKVNKRETFRVDDIPKFIRGAHYQTNIGFGFLQEWVSAEIEDCKLNLQPDFQRVREWTIEQKVKYVEFVLGGGITGIDFYFNNKRWEQDRVAQHPMDYVLVDGRNRLSALLMFLDNELPVFADKDEEHGIGYHLNDFDDPAKLKRLYSSIKVHINNLQTDVEIYQWYLDFNAGGIAHTPEEIAKVRHLKELAIMEGKG